MSIAAALTGVALAVAAVLLYYCLYVPWAFVRDFKARGVPCKPFVPLGGQLKEFEGLKDEEFVGYWVRSAAELGPNFGMCMGPYPFMVISDPLTCHDIFTSKAKHYNKHSQTAKELMRPLLKNGVLVSEGAHWQKQRELLEPAFHHHELRKMVAGMVAGADAMVRRWSSLERLDAHHELAKVGLDIVATAAFGSGFSADEAAMDRVTRAHARCLASMKERMLLSLVPVLNKAPLPSLQRYKAAAAVIHDAADGVLRARLAEGYEGKPRDMLDMLVALARDGRMTQSELREEAINVLAAGAETTSNLMSWLVFALVQRPDLWRRCADEVDRVLPRRAAPDAETLRPLDAVEACAYEALRLYAPAPMLHKLSMEGHVLRTSSGGGGTFYMRPNTHVVINAQLVHRDEAVWPRPLEFDPSRFLAATQEEAEALRQRPPFSLVAFSAGPRKCLGKNFAMLEIKAVVARILQNFVLELEPGQTIVPDPNSQSPSNGMWMRVRRRTDAECEEGARRNDVAGREGEPGSAGAGAGTQPRPILVRPTGMI